MRRWRKKFQVGVKSWQQWIADDFRIPKLSLISLKTSCCPQTQQNETKREGRKKEETLAGLRPLF
jgi:hypothetical protein